MITIRSLKKNDDFTDLITLSRAFFSEYEAHHADFFKIDELKDVDITRYFSSFCGYRSRKAYIAIDDHHIVGYITVYIKDQADYWQIKKLGEISGLMVQQDHRRQGIAEQLLEHAKEFFTTHSVKYYLVYTAVDNQAGLHFYFENGLVPLYTTLIGTIQTTI